MGQGRQCSQKKTRIEHLNIDAELIHVGQPSLDIFHLAAFPRSIVADVSSFDEYPAADLPKLIGAAFCPSHRRLDL